MKRVLAALAMVVLLGVAAAAKPEPQKANHGKCMSAAGHLPKPVGNERGLRELARTDCFFHKITARTSGNRAP